MKRDAILVLIFSAFPLLFSFTQNPEYTLYINSNGIEKSLTLGYHPFATDGIDTALGEINLIRDSVYLIQHYLLAKILDLDVVGVALYMF